MKRNLVLGKGGSFAAEDDIYRIVLAVFYRLEQGRRLQQVFDIRILFLVRQMQQSLEMICHIML